MSRITESQRMLIRSEVRHMLNRSLLREADEYPTSEEDTLVLEKLGSSDDWDFYYDAETDTSYIYGIVGADKDKAYYAAGDTRIEPLENDA